MLHTIIISIRIWLLIIQMVVDIFIRQQMNPEPDL